MSDAGQIAGYELQEWIGDGAWSSIYRAHQVALDRPVIVKIMRPEIAEDESQRSAILTAARRVARISHSHLVCGLDVGEDAGRFYFAMESVVATSVEDALREHTRLPERQCLRVCARIARALHAVHGGLLVHRAVRPRSMLVTQQGMPKLTDLGAASLESVRDLADAGHPSTAWYISPEMAEGTSEGDTASDLYALGVSLFQMLAGEVPFDGDTPEDVRERHRLSPPPSLRAIVPAISLATDEVIKRCLAKRASARFVNGNELADALDRIAKEERSSAPSADVPTVRVAKAAPGAAAKARPAKGQAPMTRRSRRRRRR